MVERAALEMRFTGNRNVGSNPTLSANISMRTNEMGLTRPENPQLPRVFAVGDRIPETAENTKIGL